MKIQGCCLIGVLLTASTWISSAMPPLSPETVDAYHSRFPGDLTLVVYRLALRTNDQAVADAALYNEMHVLAASSDAGIAESALAQMADRGDDYSITWLDKLTERPDLAARHPLFRRTQEAIAQRLERTPAVTAQIVEERLLRSAVSDITCNRLELTLPKHVRAWALANGSNALVAAELERVADCKVPAKNMNFIVLAHHRAGAKAKAYLQPTMRQQTVIRLGD